MWSRTKNLGQIGSDVLTFIGYQIESSTIDGNVEFVHSQYSCILTSQVSDNIINNSDNFVIKCFSYSKISAILCVL